MDGATRGKPGPENIGGVIGNFEGQVLLSFSKFIGVRDSNEVEILVIVEALRLCASSIQEMLMVASDSSNVVSCVSSIVGGLWEGPIFSKMKSSMPLSLKVEFRDILWAARFIGQGHIMWMVVGLSGCSFFLLQS